MSTQNMTGTNYAACLRQSAPTDLSSPPSFSLLHTQQLSAAGAAGSSFSERNKTEETRREEEQARSPTFRFFSKIDSWAAEHRHTVCSYTKNIYYNNFLSCLRSIFSLGKVFYLCCLDGIAGII